MWVFYSELFFLDCNRILSRHQPEIFPPSSRITGLMFWMLNMRHSDAWTLAWLIKSLSCITNEFISKVLHKRINHQSSRFMKRYKRHWWQKILLCLLPKCKLNSILSENEIDQQNNAVFLWLLKVKSKHNSYLM